MTREKEQPGVCLINETKLKKNPWQKGGAGDSLHDPFGRDNGGEIRGDLLPYERTRVFGTHMYDQMWEAAPRP